MKTLVMGHKNPDTDSIISAIAASDLLTKRGIDSEPGAQGDPTPETMFILNKFGLKAPNKVTSVAGRKLVLVDYSDKAQAPSDIDKAEIVAIIDHHKLGDITTTSPLLMWVWPVGCSGTIIKLMYDYYGIEIPAPIAGALTCAILSDTVIFKSPTTTDEDIKAVEHLSKIAGIEDYKALGMEIFTAKSAVAGYSAEELLFRDYKDFVMNGKKIGIGQLEVIDIALLDSIKNDLIVAVENTKKDGRDIVFLLLTDIMKEGSELLTSADDLSVIERAFGAKAASSVWLPKVISRKKDIVPQLEKALSN